MVRPSLFPLRAKTCPTENAPTQLPKSIKSLFFTRIVLALGRRQKHVWQSVFVACVLSPFFIIEKKKRDVVLKRQPFLTKNHPRSS
jgi:hypothetical protein